jgi:hypothetical protein
VQRQQDKERFGDLAKMAASLQKLIDLRLRLRDMSALSVSTASMAIGRRISPGEPSMTARIDRDIATARAAIVQIANNQPYDAAIVAKLMARLRDDIAADATLDAFDATDVGRAAKAAGMPDDVRQLAAYRANPIQKVAEFTVAYFTSLHTTPPSFFELFGYDLLTVNGAWITANGDYVSEKSVMARPGALNRYQTQVADILHGISVDPSSNWSLDMVNSTTQAPTIVNTDGTTIVLVRQSETFVSVGHHAAIFALDKFAQNGGYIEYRRISAGTVETKGKWFITASYVHTRVALDTDGNVWILRSPTGLLSVYNRDGELITENSNTGIRALVVSASGGVWALFGRDNGYAIIYSRCAKLRLPPAAEYNRGL